LGAVEGRRALGGARSSVGARENVQPDLSACASRTFVITIGANVQLAVRGEPRCALSRARGGARGRR
jgi:hypothetical protein